MNISGIPLQVTLTNFPAKSTPTGTARENISIYEDDITAVLWQRWIACYMLYDWNFRHADFAYESNKYTWIEQVCKRLEGTSINAGALENTLTDTFNHVLLEDLEDFIQTHMRVWECDRLTVEFHVTRLIEKLFTVKPKGGRREPDIRVPFLPILMEKHLFFRKIIQVFLPCGVLIY